ncbi:hypothetical protein D3C87_1055770 [compost metagenome]
MFVLFGVISPYDGSYILGVFDSLDKAIEGRSTFRKNYWDTNKSEAYESYEIYAHELNVLGEQHQPVDVFVPGKTKRPKGRH